MRYGNGRHVFIDPSFALRSLFTVRAGCLDITVVGAEGARPTSSPARVPGEAVIAGEAARGCDVS